MISPRLATLLSIGLLAACGNSVSAEVIGTTGVSLDSDGDLVALVATCGAKLDRLTVAGDRQGLAEDEPNPQLVDVDLPAATDGIATVELAMSGVAPGWTTGDGAVLEDGRTYIVGADISDEDTETVPASFQVDQLAGLDADQVIVGEGTISTRAALEASCD